VLSSDPKILIIRLSSLGDIVLTQSLVSYLKSVFPAAEIHFLTKPEFASLLTCFAPRNLDRQANQSTFKKTGDGFNSTVLIDKIITYQKTVSFHLSLLREKYDFVIDLQSKLSTWLILRFVSGENKIVYNKEHLLRRLIVKGYSKKSIDSTVRLYFSVLKRMKICSDIQELPSPCLYAVGKNPDSELFTQLRQTGKKIIALFPGAAHQTKMYPVSKWGEVIQNSPNDCHYILLGGRNEDYIASVLKHSYPQKCENRCGVASLKELVSVIDECDLVLSNDSGPMHIAAALAKAQICIFGSTHPRLGFKPLNKNAVILCADLDCQPCSLHGFDRCPKGHFNCMNQIFPETILDHIKQMIINRDLYAE